MATRMQRIELRQKARCRHPLGRGIQQRDVAAKQAALDVCRVFTRQCGIEERGAHTRLMQGAHLVMHQRNQR